jgi:hypothetical protein
MLLADLSSQAEIRALPQRSYGTTVGDFEHEKALVAQLPQVQNKSNPLRSGVSAPMRGVSKSDSTARTAAAAAAR